MNFSLGLLWIIVIGTLVFFVYLALKAMKTWNDERNSITTMPATNACVVATNSVPDISLTPLCKDGQGQITASKPVTIRGLSVVVNPVPTDWETICSQNCKISYNRISKQCIDGSGNVAAGDQGNFINCANVIMPVGCRGSALPIAFGAASTQSPGENFYYVSNTDLSTCK